MSREGGATLSNFMLFNSADACPVPSWPDTDTHCHRWKLREGFVCSSRKNSLTGRGVAEETEVGRIHCFSVDGEAREVFRSHHHSGEGQVFRAYLRISCNSFGKHWKPQTARLSSRLKVGV